VALITATEARVLLPSLTSGSADSDLDTYITRAGQALAKWCAFPTDGGASTLEQATYTMYLSCPDVLNPLILQLPVRPIISVSSVNVDVNREYNASTALTEGVDFVVDKEQGRLVLTGSTSNYWTSSFEAIRVVADAGLATVPEIVKQACALTVKANWDKRQMQNLDQIQTGSDNTVFTKFEYHVPPDARDLVSDLELGERKFGGQQDVRFG